MRDREILVLAAGDGFVLPEILEEAAVARLSGARVRRYQAPWPDVAFGSVGGVDEASGTEDELISALVDVEAILTQVAPITRRVMESTPSLRFVGVSRGGPVNVDLAAARELGVVVANAPGRNATATGEMALGLILAVTRRIPEAHATLLAHEWRGSFYRFESTGPELAGSTVGLVGLGAVGRVLARGLLGLDADVVVYDPFLKAEDLPAGVRRVTDLDELFSVSRIVSVHARASADNVGLVSADRLAAMRPGGYLVNAARGSLVDYEAVVAALESGQLAGAAFDVYPDEPADFGDQLFAAANRGANVVLTPHIAGATKDVARRAASIVADDLARFVAGEPLRFAI